MTTTSSSGTQALLTGIVFTVLFLFILYSVIFSAVRRGVQEGMLLAHEDDRESRPHVDDAPPPASPSEA